MINLYRGILNKFNSNVDRLEDELIELVRSSYVENPNDNSFGSAGFWNLLLEVCLSLFTKMFIILATLLTVSLAIVFFPLNAIKVAVASVFGKIHSHQFITEEQPRKEPK
jgi:hypothetical protein